MQLPLVLLGFWALYSNLSHSPGPQMSSQFSQKSGCAGFFGSHEKSGFKNVTECVVRCPAMCFQGCRGFAMAVRRVLVQALERGSSLSPLAMQSKEQTVMGKKKM